VGYDPGANRKRDFVVPDARDFVGAEHHAADVLARPAGRFELDLSRTIVSGTGPEFIPNNRTIRCDDLDRHAAEVASRRTGQLDL